MTEDGLTDIEKAWLVGIDSLLMQSTPQGHAVTAGRIVDLWSEGGEKFKQELAFRAKAWRKRHLQMLQMVGDDEGPCCLLMQLMHAPESDNPDPSESPRSQPPEPKSGPKLRPSQRRKSPEPIDDDDVEEFLQLIDDEGIDAVFDPGNSITQDNELITPPLIRLDGVMVFHSHVWPRYEQQRIDRVWDSEEREPAIALAFDYALLILTKEMKWTWAISDRHFKRLPWDNPCKATPGNRPGWKLITGLLEGEGMISKRRGQTWKRCPNGKTAAGKVREAWTA